MAKPAPFKSLWAIIFTTWPVEIAKFYGGSLENAHTSAGEAAFLKIMASGLALVLGLLGVSFISATGTAGVLVVGVIITVFDLIRLWGYVLLRMEAAGDEEGQDRG
jgi:hypothetical protein